MKRVLKRLHRDERGMSFVFLGVGFMAFLAATTLAIDVGMFMTARSQAQTSADAGALAGALALVYDDFDNRSASGPAVQATMAAALGNDVIGQNVDVVPSDVTFPVAPNGDSNRVRVQVHRTGENGVATLMGRYFGVDRADVTAVATAEAGAANAITCVAPFTIPDKWLENQTGPWDVNDTFDMFDNHNNLLPSPDVYYPSTDRARYTGYNPIRDKGLPLMIRAGTGNNIEPSFYFSIAIGGVTGASQYEWNIANCNTTVMGFGDLLLQEPGAMMGPTTAGIDDLIARDLNARWDTSRNRLVTSMHPSPRVVIIPVFDPVYYATGVTQGRFADLKVANYIGFFIESRSGNNVYGRITPVTGMMVGSLNAPPAAAFPVVIRLVE